MLIARCADECELTLFARSTHGILSPFERVTFDSTSSFHLATASRVDLRDKSKTIIAA